MCFFHICKSADDISHRCRIQTQPLFVSIVKLGMLLDQLIYPILEFNFDNISNCECLGFRTVTLCNVSGIGLFGCIVPKPIGNFLSTISISFVYKAEKRKQGLSYFKKTIYVITTFSCNFLCNSIAKFTAVL